MKYFVLVIALLVFSGCERTSYVAECIDGAVVNTIYQASYIGEPPRNLEFYTESNLKMQWVGSDKNNSVIRCSKGGK